MMNENQLELDNKVSNLIDKYLVRTTKYVSVNSSSIRLRAALVNRIDEYFPKSRLNEILISKNRYDVRIGSADICFFNISYRDISLLANSKEILKELKSTTCGPFKEYTKLSEYRKVINYKYTFKYRIKMKFTSPYGLEFSEKFVCDVISRELCINTIDLINYIDLLNIKDCPDIPQPILDKLLDIFNITHDESLIANNYYR